MNKTSVKVGISIIIAGAVLAGLGLVIKIRHDGCLERIRAFERGASNVTPLCPADDSVPFFLAALPVMIIGILVLVLAIKDAPVLRRIFGTETK